MLFIRSLQTVETFSDGNVLTDLAGIAMAQLAMALPQEWKQMTFTSADDNIAQLEQQAKQRQVGAARKDFQCVMSFGFVFSSAKQRSVCVHL